MDKKIIDGTIKLLNEKFPAEKERIMRGVKQSAALWMKEDGTGAEFKNFCVENFAAGADLEALFNRFQEKFEYISGHFSALALNLRLETDENRGTLYPVDTMFAAYSPSAHLSDDMFKSKIAFVVLLNFPVTTLKQRLSDGQKWTRRQWADTRLAAHYSHRVPATVEQEISARYADADTYINGYNIYMDHVAGADGSPAFRSGLKLISHWGLRDELKALYADPAKNLGRQEIIYTIMQRIINQEIPAKVINSDKYMWDPVKNTVDGAPAPRENDARYRQWLDIFKAHKLEDKYYPDAPTHMDRKFQFSREIPEKEVEALFVELLTAPEGKAVAEEISKRLNRGLQPFDIWYNGFAGRGSISEEELDKIVAAKYPDLPAFQNSIPQILQQLGFDADTAAFLASKIEVDPARGAGHAWGPEMRTEKAHLRTRVPKGGMDYQGFNTAMHELGHCVEQVFSLYRVDYTLLSGVPNTAFTEGFAFVFQGKDLELLGVKQKDDKTSAMKDLSDFWASREIAGVALVDMYAWRWMYAHPKATPAQFKAQVLKIAREIWNKYYAPVFGAKDSPVLAIYSHMINSGLYIPDYPLGHIIAFQVEDYFKTHPLAKEMERMCTLGNITPAEWMRQAVGGPISAKPIINSASGALAKL